MRDTTIDIAPELRFRACVDGLARAPLVLLLHGYPQSRHSWREQLPALSAQGYCAVAPDQRGYSPTARPDPGDLGNYRYDRLVEDVIDLATALGYADQRFHLVGHDWGGQVAWGVADRHPDRLASLTVLSRPHPTAFRMALEAADGEQARRSRHHRAFLDPATSQRLLEDDARRLRAGLTDSGVPSDQVNRYLSVLDGAPALEAALAWYRANPGLRASLGSIRVPTLYVWGDADATVTRAAAEGTAAHIGAPYQFAELPGIGHFATDQASAVVNELLVSHLSRHPA
ncbi:MAG: alpha/beta hydrolase [Alphaproteobacteria bacterium]|nr:alpha/beta hydrolase [Alphaproteobacteria bacterium]